MTRSPYQTPDADGQPSMAALLVVILIVLGIQYQRQAWPFGPRQENKQIVDDDHVEPDESERGDLFGSYLVVVEESESRPVGRMKILNNHEFWFGLRDRGLKGFRILDPDNNDARSFINEAAAASINPPFVMHIAADGRVIGTIPFPRQIARIEEMLE